MKESLYSAPHIIVVSTVWFTTPNGVSHGPLVKWPKTPASHAGNTSSNLVRVTIFKKLNNLILDSESYLIYSANRHTRKVGAYSGEGPPVPIPNTEVKLACAEDTWREAARENR